MARSTKARSRFSNINPDHTRSDSSLLLGTHREIMATSLMHFQDCVGGLLLIFIRWLLKLFKKECAGISRYQRSHRHFLRYLALDALLSVVLVFAGFQIFGASSSSAERLTHAGDVVMSSGQLVDHLAKDGLNAYWLGPIESAEYTVNHELHGIVDVMYLPKGTDASDDRAFIYEVKTYKSKEVWDSHTHPIKSTVSTTTIFVDKNTSVRINPSSMKGAIATFGDRPVIVAIAYPKPQTLDDIIKNVKSLKLVR
jgi:hypothetical protein